LSSESESFSSGRRGRGEDDGCGMESGWTPLLPNRGVKRDFSGTMGGRKLLVKGRLPLWGGRSWLRRRSRRRKRVEGGGEMKDVENAVFRKEKGDKKKEKKRK